MASKKLSHPIEQMKEMAERFASGDFRCSVSLRRAAELSKLAEAMNEMARQLSSKIATITEDRNQIQAIFPRMIKGVIAVDSAAPIVGMNKARS